MNKEQGFLLSYLKYSDFDAIIHFFGYQSGYQSYFLKGIYRKNSRKKSLLAPLNELILHLPPGSPNLGLHRINDFELGKESLDQDNFKSSAVLFFACDFLNQILRNQPPSKDLYQEIKYFLQSLNQNSTTAHLILITRILRLQGHYPLLSKESFLDPAAGEFKNELSHPLFSKDISQLYKDCFSNDLPYEQNIPPRDRRSFLDSLMVYCQYHLDGFRLPKSLEVARELF